MTASMKPIPVSEVSPLRHVWDITARGQGKDNIVYETFCALPSPVKPYSGYDYAVVAEIISGAETTVANAYEKGEGSGIVTLQSVLQAYDRVLPRHGIKPEEDTYFYRLLLKLSLDPELDWRTKLSRETGIQAGPTSFSTGSVSALSSSIQSILGVHESRASNPHLTSPTRPARARGSGITGKPSGRKSGTTTGRAVRSTSPGVGAARASSRTAPLRSSASTATASDLGSQADTRPSAQHTKKSSAAKHVPWKAPSVALREATAQAARIASAQASRVAALRAQQEASWDVARQVVRQEAAAREALPASREASWQASHVAAGRQAAVFQAAQEVASREAARDAVAEAAREAAAEAVREAQRGGAGFREMLAPAAMDAVPEAALHAAHDAVMQEAAALDAAAREAALREASLAEAQHAVLREAALREAALREAAARADAARQAAAHEEVMRRAAAGQALAHRQPNAAGLPRDPAAQAAHDAVRRAAAASAVQAASAALAASAAASAARRATEGVWELRPSHDTHSYPSRNPPPALSMRTSASGPSAPSVTESADGQSFDGPYTTGSEGAGLLQPHSGRYADFASENGAASSDSGVPPSVGTTAPSSLQDFSRAGLARPFSPHASAGVPTADTFVGGPSAERRDALQSESRDDIYRRGERGGSPQPYVVSRYLASSGMRPLHSVTGLDSASVHSASDATGVSAAPRSNGDGSRPGVSVALSGRQRGAASMTAGTRSDSGHSTQATGRVGMAGLHNAFAGLGSSRGVTAATSNSGSSTAGPLSRGGTYSSARSDEGSVRGNSLADSAVRAGTGDGSGRSSSALAEAGYSVGTTGDSHFSASNRGSGASTEAASDKEGSISAGSHIYGSDVTAPKGIAGRFGGSSDIGPPGFSGRTESFTGGSGAALGGKNLYGGFGHSSIRGFGTGDDGGSAARGLAARRDYNDTGDAGASLGLQSTGGSTTAGVGLPRAPSGRSESDSQLLTGASSGSLGSLGREGSFSFGGGLAGAYRPGAETGSSRSVGTFQPRQHRTNAGYAAGGIGDGDNMHGSSGSVLHDLPSTGQASQTAASSLPSTSVGSSVVSIQPSDYPATSAAAAGHSASLRAGSGVSGRSSPTYLSSADHDLHNTPPTASGRPGGENSYMVRGDADNLSAPASSSSQLDPASSDTSRMFSYYASTQPVSRSGLPFSRDGSATVTAVSADGSSNPAPARDAGFGPQFGGEPDVRAVSSAAEGSAASLSIGGSGRGPLSSMGGINAYDYQGQRPSSTAFGHHEGGPTSPRDVGGSAASYSMGRGARGPVLNISGTSAVEYQGQRPGSMAYSLHDDGPVMTTASRAVSGSAASFGMDGSSRGPAFGRGMDAGGHHRQHPDSMGYRPQDSDTTQNYSSVSGIAFSDSDQESPTRIHGGVRTVSSPALLIAGGFSPHGSFTPGPAAMGRTGLGSPSDGASDESSVLAEETEAYMDFSRMARAFRTWRANTAIRQVSRSERDQALHNWAVATSFWAIQLLRRCFYSWRGLGLRKDDMATAAWDDNSRAGCFRRWLVFTRYLRSKSAQCDRMWRHRLLQRCLRQWREYNWRRQRKAAANRLARERWASKTVHESWRQWRAYSAAKQRKALKTSKALAFWAGRTLRRCWREWRRFTTTQGRLALAMDKATVFWEDRSLRQAWQAWRSFIAVMHRKVLGQTRAVAFWRGRWLRVCWQEWRGVMLSRRHKVVSVAMALEFWMGSSLRGCWRQWREFTARQQRKALAHRMAQEFWSTRTLRGCISEWRQFIARQQHKALTQREAWQFRTSRILRACLWSWKQVTAEQQRKAEGAAKAAFFWTSRTLRACFTDWRYQYETARHFWELSGHIFLRRVLVGWRSEAASLAKLSRAYHTIQEYGRKRRLRGSIQALLKAHSDRNEFGNRLRVALLQLRQRRLARSLRLWREALRVIALKREREALALSWGLQRCLARSWRAWCMALASSQLALQAAREHSQRALRPLLRDAFYSWLDYHEDKMLRRSRNVEARRIMETRRRRLVLRSWRGLFLEERHLEHAFQAIMRHEVHRLMGGAFRQLRREHDGLRRAAEGRRVVQSGVLLRCFYSWKALGQARLAKEEWRAQRLHLAVEQRVRRVLLAWQLVASLHAEHDRVVQACIAKKQRRLATVMLRGWHERVLYSAAKRMKMLAALLAWEKGLKTRAWRSWRQLLIAANANASRFALAARHHRTRRLALCFGVLLREWQQYRVLLGRAALYRSMHSDLLLREVLGAWRQMTEYLRWKNAKLHRAIEHSRNRLLAGTLYAWYYITRHRIAVKQAVAVAVLHWIRRRRAAAFRVWREWAAHRHALNVRCAAYQRVRQFRIRECVLQGFRANIVRNVRVAGAIIHHKRYVARLALSGWLLRTLLATEWANRLSQVGKQLTQQLLVSALAGWLEYAAYRRQKSAMLQTAMHYWRLERQRSALDCLRWNATRRQVKRAAVARGLRSTAVRVLQAWREHVEYRRQLRHCYTVTLMRSRRTALQRGLNGWRTYLAHRVRRRDQYDLASRHLLRGTVRRVFRRWHGYHRHLVDASEGAREIARRWNSRDAAVVLAALAEHVELRRMVRTAEDLYRRRLAGRAVQAWKEFLVVEKALGFWSHNRLRGVLMAWSWYTQWKRHLRFTGNLITKRHRSLLASAVLGVWHSYAREHARLMALGLQLANRTNRSALAAMLGCWLEHATRSARLRRASLEVAGRVCTRLLTSVLLSWQETAARRVFLKDVGATIAARSRRSMLLAAFGHWAAHAARVARLRTVSEQVTALARRRLLGDAFGAWRWRAAWNTQLAATAMLVASQVLQAKLHNALAGWAWYASYKVQRRETAEMAVRHMRLRATASLFNFWRTYAAYRLRLRLAGEQLAGRVRHGTASAVLAAWNARALCSAHLRRAAQLVASRMRLSTLGSSFGGWRMYAGRRTQLRATGERLCFITERRTASRCLAAWRSRAAYKGRLAAGLLHTARCIRRRALARVVGAWHVYAAYKVHLRRVEKEIAERLRQQTLGGVFGGWRKHARHMASLQGLLERVLVRSTALAFFGWRELVHDAKRRRAVQAATQERLLQAPALKEVASYAIARLRYWPLSVAFYTWYDNALEARYFREKTTQAVFGYAGTLMRKAWSTWLAYALQHRHLRQKLTRCHAAARRKKLKAVLDQWWDVALYLRRLRLTAARLQDLVRERVLRDAFESWLDATMMLIQLKGILARIMARQLAAAWEGWLEAVREGRARAQAVGSIRARWQRRDLHAVLLSWHRVAACSAAARRMNVRGRQRLLISAWAGWQEAVFLAGLERGGELHEARLRRRVLRGWRAIAVDSRRGAALRQLLQQRVARQAINEWRQQWMARAAFRRLYARRALLGWWQRTQELRQMRAQLWHITRVILQGCMARSFDAWRQHAQAMAIKRTVFIRKQRALADALRRGDELAARRKAELLEVAFRAWQQRAAIWKQMQLLLATRRARTLATMLARWVHFTQDQQVLAAKQNAVLRHRLLTRPFRSWRKATADAAAKAIVADAHRRTTLLGFVLAGWMDHHAAVGVRRLALGRAMSAGLAAAASALKARAWDAWREAMVQRLVRLDLVEQALQRRRLRALGLAFDVWLKYTQAMRSGGIDPGSPYLTPRDTGTDRRLVTRMAALAGNEQVLAESNSSASVSLLDGLYPSAALQQALERRHGFEAFLSAVRGAGIPASPAAAARDQLTAAALARQRQRERRDSHGSSSHGSGSTVVSSGAGGADLADLALAVVQATPSLSPVGKLRPAGGVTAPKLHAGYTGGNPHSAAPLSPDWSSSPYDDRLDLRALYDIVGPHLGAAPAAAQQGSFRGFPAGRQPSGSPHPLPPRQVATPMTASGPIAPRRIDFSAGRGPGGPAGALSLATMAGSSQRHLASARLQQQQQQLLHLPLSSLHDEQLRSQLAGQGQWPAGTVEADADSDVASTTSSDLLGPAWARSRAAAGVAAAAAASEDFLPSRQGSATLRQKPAGSSAAEFTGKGGGVTPASEQGSRRTVPGQGASGQSGAVFLGAPLARQPGVGGVGAMLPRGSILDRRSAGGR